MIEKTDSGINPLFQPSTATKVLSLLTHPKFLGGTLTLMATGIIGFSMPVSLGAAVLVVTAEDLFIKIVSGGDTLRSSVYSLMDHLSRDNIKGGLPFNTLPPMIKALNKLNSPNAKKAISSLEGLLAYEQCFDYLGVNNYYLQQDLINKIRTLNPDELLVFPLSHLNLKEGGHILLGSVQRHEDNTYLLRIHNGDSGSINFHHKRIERETGRTLYQTTMEVDAIKLEQISKLMEFSEKLHAFHFSDNSDSEQLYQFISKLEGNILPPNPDSRYWMRNQQGFSCSGYSILCFLHFVLSPEEFVEYQKHLLRDSTLTLKNGIEHGFFFERTPEHFLAYDELRSKTTRMRLPDPGALNLVKPGQASMFSSWAQNKFWSNIFPVSLSSYFKDKLGIDTRDYDIIGSIREFRSLSNVMKPFDPYNYPPPKENEVQSLIPIAKQTLTSFYNTLDLIKLTEQDQMKLKNAYTRLMSSENINSAYLNIFDFYKFAFKTYSFQFNSPRTRLLGDVITFLSEKNYEQARVSLQNAYQSFMNQETLTLSKEEQEDCQIILCYTLYLKDAIVLEDLELRAGLATLFKQLNNKVSLSLRIPEYLKKNLSFYTELRLDQEFPTSSWKEDILKGLEDRRLDCNSNMQC